MNLKTWDLALLRFLSSLVLLMTFLVLLMMFPRGGDVQVPCEASPQRGHWAVLTENGMQVIHNSETGKTIYQAFRATEDGFVGLDLEEYAQQLNAEIAETQQLSPFD